MLKIVNNKNRTKFNNVKMLTQTITFRRKFRSKILIN